MPSSAAHLQLGAQAEQLALEYLQQQGLKLVARNFRCRLGEIDLIMHKGQTLVFIEVRSRSRKDAYDPIASIGYHKQQRLLRSAMVFLQAKPAYASYCCRFDVIGITYTEGQPQIHWIKEAFSL